MTSSRRDRLAERREAVELVEQPQRRVVGAQVEPRRLAGRRRLGAVRGAQHRAHQRPHAVDRRLGAAQLGEHRHRRLAQPLGLLLDAAGAAIARPRSRPST